ncbi:MAG: AMP-binding protein [Mangrovibacterium sp.]
MNTHPLFFTLNDRKHRVSDILSSRGKHHELPWQAQWMNFLSEWYNENSYIEVRTSGSTGKPKLIRLEKSFVAASAQRTLSFFQLKTDDKILHCLPSNFIAGKLMLVRALMGELNIHIVDPSSSFDFLAHEIYAFTAMVSNQLHKLLNSNKKHIPIKQILVGGSAIPYQLEEELAHINSICYSSYAMTETATHIALRRLNHCSPKDKYYHCLDGIEVCTDEQDCLLIKMPGIASTGIATNDIARLIDNKTFQIVGRIDNCIICGGKKFFAEEIERKITHAINQDFIISSQKNDSLGEELILIIESTYSVQLECEIKAICKRLLSKHEQPRAFLFVNQLARTENGKIKRAYEEQKK